MEPEVHLEDIVRAPSPRQRILAIYHAVEIGDKGAVPFLLEALDDHEVSVEQPLDMELRVSDVAVRALGRLGAIETGDRVRSIFDSSQACDTRASAAAALVNMGAISLQELDTLCGRADRLVFVNACFMTSDRQAAQTALLRVLQSPSEDKHIRRRIAHGLPALQLRATKRWLRDNYRIKAYDWNSRRVRFREWLLRTFGV